MKSIRVGPRIKDVVYKTKRQNKIVRCRFCGKEIVKCSGSYTGWAHKRILSKGTHLFKATSLALEGLFSKTADVKIPVKEPREMLVVECESPGDATPED